MDFLPQLRRVGTCEIWTWNTTDSDLALNRNCLAISGFNNVASRRWSFHCSSLAASYQLFYFWEKCRIGVACKRSKYLNAQSFGGLRLHILACGALQEGILSLEVVAFPGARICGNIAT